MNRNGNSANFFSYVRNDKKSKELFASFLNGILISVICVSSIKLVFNAWFDQLLAAHLNNKSVRAEETRHQWRVLLVGTRWRSTFIAVFIVYAKNESIFYFPTIYKGNRNYTSMLGKSTHLAVIPQQSTQNTANLPLQTYEKNQWTFL